MKAAIALGGNLNSGKPTLFNERIGIRLHVGNYPGVMKKGSYIHNEYTMRVADLPGT